MGYLVEEEWQKREESRGTCERTGWDELSSEDEESISGCIDLYVIAQSFHYACESHARVIGILS